VNRLRRAWRAFLDLSWPQRRSLALAWLLLPAGALGLRLLGFTRLQAVLLPRRRALASRTDVGEAQAIARMVDAAGRWNPVQTSCLVRSLVLCHLLRRKGLAAELRIGVTPPDGNFSAHAWVEHEGVALAEAGAAGARYSAFDDPALPRGI